MDNWMHDTLRYVFKNPELLAEALTHTTYANENQRARSNERLEFLGDSVVGMVVAQYIYTQYPNLPEGDLTKIRAAVVCEPSLAARARVLQIGQMMRFGKGETVAGRDRDSTLADAFEAVAGAMFLDGGLEVARSFILRELAPTVTMARSGQVRVDYKTRLQEYLQERFPEGPAYRLLGEEGPPHNKRFHVAVYHQDRELGTGWGRNKKEAEQEAAREAMGALHES